MDSRLVTSSSIRDQSGAGTYQSWISDPCYPCLLVYPLLLELAVYEISSCHMTVKIVLSRCQCVLVSHL
jgi:hypothetical protein